MTYPTQPPVDTGNPGLNSIIRSVVIGASALLTGLVTAQLNARGWTMAPVNLWGTVIDPSVLIFGAVFGVVAGFAAAVWGYLRGTQLGKWLANVRLEGVQAGVAAQAAMTATTPVATPAAITHADANAIVGQFGPRSLTADDLNAAELKRIKP